MFYVKVKQIKAQKEWNKILKSHNMSITNKNRFFKNGFDFLFETINQTNTTELYQYVRLKCTANENQLH